MDCDVVGTNTIVNMAKRTRTSKFHMLWWVRDSQHIRDHFVIAQHRDDARWHLRENDADRTVRAGCLGAVDGSFENGKLYTPSLKQLIAWGFQVIHADDPLVVWREGVLYRYGWEFEGPMLMYYEDRPGVYIVNLRGTHLWKVGLSKGLTDRLSGHRRNIPLELVLDRHIPCHLPAKLEYDIKKELRPWRYDREWFFLCREEVDHVIAYATMLAQRRS